MHALHWPTLTALVALAVACPGRAIEATSDAAPDDAAADGGGDAVGLDALASDADAADEGSPAPSDAQDAFDPCANANCADPSGFVCDPQTGQCVECVSNDQCHGTFTNGNPNAICLPGHTCGCDADGQCVTQAEGTQCLMATNVCGCNDASGCTMSSDGRACLHPAAPFTPHCGCNGTGDCPAGKTCNMSYCG